MGHRPFRPCRDLDVGNERWPSSRKYSRTFSGRPVIDATGITDSCDIELTGEYDTPEALIKALRGQLRLELTKSL
jgi:hypothetical protein